MIEVKDDGSPLRQGYHRPIPIWMDRSLSVGKWVHEHRDAVLFVVFLVIFAVGGWIR